MAEKRLTREEANELYDNLSKRMTTMIKKQSVSVGAVKSGSTPATKTATPTQVVKAPTNASSLTKKDDSTGSKRSFVTFARGADSYRGQVVAACVIALFCCAKVTVSALEASGIASVAPAEATAVARTISPSTPQWSKEEVKILTALDRRRSELEERAGRLEQREHEFASRDRDLAARLTELKEITERLKLDREKSEKQRDVQLDQLANVYGSMNPPEAAHLLEQLDVGIALSLIQRMPEKRIGQILSLMSAARALELTNRLSMRSSR